MDNDSSLSSNNLIVKPDATSAELDKLMQTNNKSIRKAVALHPNTSPETLVKLFGDNFYFSSINYLEQVLKNPFLKLILLEQPDFLDRLHKQPYRFIYSCAKLPQFFIDWAVNHVKASVRSEIALNYYIPIDCLVRLAQDMNSNVRCSVAGNVCISNKDFEWLNREKVTDRTANHHPHAVYKMICQLAKDRDMNVRYVVANNTGTPTHILEQLSFDFDLNVLGAVARNRKTPEIILRQLFQNKSQFIAEAIASNKNIPSDLMKIYAASDNTRVRYFIADNSSATVAILTKLAFDKDRMIRQQVANNSNTPDRIIKHLAKEGVQKYSDIPF